MSKIPASNPPQKIAAMGREGEPLMDAATEEADEVLIPEPFKTIIQAAKSTSLLTGKPV